MHRRVPRLRSAIAALALASALVAVPAAGGDDTGTEATRYTVVLAGEQTGDGFVSDVDTDDVVALIETLGGTITADLTDQIGVLIVESTEDAFADTLRDSGLVEEVGEDFVWEAFPNYAEQVESGGLDLLSSSDEGAEETEDPLEPLQWGMQMIRTPEAHGTQAGWGAVDVGILDTGVDATHLDFALDGGGTNVDCERGRDFVVLVGPGVGSPAPCTDNNFHGTHVAGIVAAQANGYGVVGVAPNVMLVPVKVCDSTGFCYSSSTVAGITYAGDAKLDVINMSFFVDDDDLLESTEFKCNDDEQQRAFRKANERAIKYARGQGVTPVAALGNSDADLAHPESGNNCEVVPAETTGVIGVAALGPESEKAFYSNYGSGAVDVAAPGGSGTTGDCEETILSTFPANTFACIQGTSMASPHAAGVAALIVSQLGELDDDGDVAMEPSKVQSQLQATAIDIGEKGYDECFGNGRIDALRAVQDDTSKAYDATAPFCPEYEE